MSVVHAWTLWQCMPPRYQLTTHSYNMDTDEFIVVGNATDSSKNNVSPRPVSSGRRSNRPNSRSKLNRDNIMLSTCIVDPALSAISSATKQHTSKSFSFPRRNSDYVSTFQKQRWVNSARRRLAEIAPMTNVPGKQQSMGVFMTPRAQTAPMSPVTTTENPKDKRLKPSESSPPENKSLHINLNIKSKPIGEPNKVNMFHDTNSLSSTMSSVHRQRETDPKQKPKKYIVKETDKATVYIDRGKVMYFGKSRHDFTQLLNTQSSRAHRNTCFLAEIRRDYLKHPKYERCHSSTSRKTDNDTNRIANERVDYNKRVEHILNYYDEDGNIPQNTRPRPASGYSIKSPKGAHVKGLSLTHTASAQPTSRTASPSSDPAECSNDFIRLNRQLKLHKRQYLRTPGVQHGNNGSAIDTCRCSMCRMELQLALVTRTTCASVDATTDVIVGAMTTCAGGDATTDVIVGAMTTCEGGDATTDMTVGARTTCAGGETTTDVTVGETPKEGNHIDNDISSNVRDKANIYMGKSNKLKATRITYNVHNNAHKVSFHHPEVNLVDRAQATRFISCKLPEVDAMTANESGFESALSYEVTCPDDIRPELNL